MAVWINLRIFAGMKLKVVIFFAVIVALYSAFTSCVKDEPENGEKDTKRTVLVYMVANNNLSSYSDRDIEEMQAAVQYNDLNGGRLLIYHAPISGLPALKEITPNGIEELKVYDNEIYSTDAERMHKVFSDVLDIAPALDYGLVLWSHSDAWRETAASRSTGIKPLSFGIDRNYSMKITTLADVLSDFNFSFIYFDCCHMASIEVAYELRNVTDYIVASGTELPAAGMPYNINVPLFFSDTPDLEQACKNTFDYYNNQVGNGKSCTMSLIATEYIDELANISREVFKAKVALSDKPIQSYIRVPQMFSYDILSDMAEYMHAISPDAATTLRWDIAFNQVVLYKAATPTIFGQLTIDSYCGLGCYVPRTIEDANVDGYCNQSWWKDVVAYYFQ